MHLPSEDSAFWSWMEDDIAEERWPLPLLYRRLLSFWYAGPRNELHRRVAFHDLWRARLARRSRWHWGVSALIVAQSLFFAEARVLHWRYATHLTLWSLCPRILLPVFAWAGMILLAWAITEGYRRGFDRYVRRYMADSSMRTRAG